MQRIAVSELDLTLKGEAELVFLLAVAAKDTLREEHLSFTLDGVELDVAELAGDEGTRLHTVHAGPGQMQVRYRAVIDGRAQIPPVNEIERIAMMRPSRYAESDELFSDARRRFSGLSGMTLVNAVREHVASTMSYVPGSTIPTDSAASVLAHGQGVCRDYSHAVIAMLRAMDVPARYVACYAPGLDPMDFHALAEAYVDGAWYVIDATRLSHRESLVRIATGRDAADCAFLSSYGDMVVLDRLFIDAWIDEEGTRIDPTPDLGWDPVQIS